MGYFPNDSAWASHHVNLMDRSPQAPFAKASIFARGYDVTRQRGRRPLTENNGSEYAYDFFSLNPKPSNLSTTQLPSPSRRLYVAGGNRSTSTPYA
jgi:hypothetical protein